MDKDRYRFQQPLRGDQVRTNAIQPHKSIMPFKLFTEDQNSRGCQLALTLKGVLSWILYCKKHVEDGLLISITAMTMTTTRRIKRGILMMTTTMTTSRLCLRKTPADPAPECGYNELEEHSFHSASVFDFEPDGLVRSPSICCHFGYCILLWVTWNYCASTVKTELCLPSRRVKLSVPSRRTTLRTTCTTNASGVKVIRTNVCLRDETSSVPDVPQSCLR